jgi:hypothetical protein
MRLNGREQCLGEFFEECIEMKKITDVIMQKDTYYYVFEDGHKLPLLCSCCDKPLGIHDLDAVRKAMVGRELKNILCDTVEIGKTTTVENIQLEFTRKFLEFKRMTDEVSILSAQKIIHPPSCSNMRPLVKIAQSVLPSKKKKKK